VEKGHGQGNYKGNNLKNKQKERENKRLKRIVDVGFVVD
jgi:hypothetical protein